jgi:hypothetical protein
VDIPLVVVDPSSDAVASFLVVAFPFLGVAFPFLEAAFPFLVVAFRIASLVALQEVETFLAAFQAAAFPVACRDRVGAFLVAYRNLVGACHILVVALHILAEVLHNLAEAVRRGSF